MKNVIIDNKSEDKADEKEVTLMAFNGTCHHHQRMKNTLFQPI